ncbi:hypothetical protein Tco_0689142, partial [Tanacetum coccineum]
NIRSDTVCNSQMEDRNPARANIKQLLGYSKDGDCDGLIPLMSRYGFITTVLMLNYKDITKDNEIQEVMKSSRIEDKELTAQSV